MRIMICAVITVATLLIAPVAMADERAAQHNGSIGMQILDLALVRPVAIAVAAASTTLYVGTLPLTYPIGIAGDVAPYMVMAPWRFMSTRYFGNFSEYRDHRSIEGWEPAN